MLVRDGDCCNYYKEEQTQGKRDRDRGARGTFKKKLTDAGNVDAGGVQNGRDFSAFGKRRERSGADSVAGEENDGINRRCFNGMADSSNEPCGTANRFVVRHVDVVHVVTAMRVCAVG